MAAKLIRWLIFSLIFSLIPLFVDFIAENTRNNGSFGTASFGRHGELFLLASAMCAVGLGEILGVNQKFYVFKIMAGGASLAIIALATALYTISASDTAIALLNQTGVQQSANENFSKNVLSYSIVTFIFASIVSTSCIALSEVK